MPAAWLTGPSDSVAMAADGAELGFQPVNERFQIAPEKKTNVAQLQGVQPPDPALDITDKRLGPSELPGKRHLGNASVDPQFAQAPQEHFVFGSMDGLGHGHDLTAWRPTLYSVFRYLNSRYSAVLGRADTFVGLSFNDAVSRAWAFPRTKPCRTHAFAEFLKNGG